MLYECIHFKARKIIFIMYLVYFEYHYAEKLDTLQPSQGVGMRGKLNLQIQSCEQNLPFGIKECASFLNYFYRQIKLSNFHT